MRPLLGPLRDLRIFVRFVRERGVRHAGRIGALAVRGRLMAAADRRREAHFGVDSEGNIALGQLAIESENRALGFPYVPSPGLLVDTLLANVGEELSRFSFVDFGSGKGRVLLVASHYPFREVVGVEFSPELHETAEANIRRYQSPQRRCPRVRSVCADAATFALPAPDCVLYFNNPFAEPVFARVLANVQAAHERSRGKLYVLYQQLAGELETDRTQNIAMLGRSAFLRERHVRFPSRRSRYLPTGRGLLRPAEVRIRRSGLYVVALARLAPRPRRRGRKGDPYRKPRLSRNLALPATRQPGTAGKHGVRPKRSWLERERQKRPSLVRKAKADRNAGGVFTGIHRCGGARYRRRTVAGSALRCSRAVLTIHTEHRSWTEEEVR